MFSDRIKDFYRFLLQKNLSGADSHFTLELLVLRQAYSQILTRIDSMNDQSCIKYSTNKYQYQYQYLTFKYQYQYKYCA